MATSTSLPAPIMEWAESHKLPAGWSEDLRQRLIENFRSLFGNPTDIEQARAIDSIVCYGRSGSYWRSAFDFPHGIGTIRSSINGDGDEFYYIITEEGLFTFEYEVIATPEMIDWAITYSSRHDLTEAEIRADFFRYFGEQPFETWTVMDLYLRDTRGQYERELYPGRTAKAYQLPANRGATWYVVQRNPGVFTCDVKHFPKKSDAKREARRIRREIQREEDEENHWREMEEATDDEVPHFDERDLCNCGGPSPALPNCGGCYCGCGRGCVSGRLPRHACDFHEDDSYESD